MKYKLIVLALAVATPSVVWAGVNFLNTDPVYVISNNDYEDRPLSTVKNYRLTWNQTVGKFDLRRGDERRPITVEESKQPAIKGPKLFEPVYYGDDFSV